MKRIELRNLIIVVLFCIISACEKDNEEGVSDKFFIKFSSNDTEYQLTEGVDNYQDGIYHYQIHTGIFGYGGGLYNNEFQLNNSSYTSLDKFTVIFHNIEFEDIIEGDYKFKNSIYGTDTIQSGIEIRWMNNIEWDVVLNNYKQTQEYLDCVSSFEDGGESICSSAMRGDHDFFSTRNLNQPESIFEVTNRELKLYEKMWYCDDNTQQVYDLVIEGNFQCNSISKLDSTNLKSILGTFKIHIPSPLKFDCNDDSY
jgi:hypothetical protein